MEEASIYCVVGKAGSGTVPSTGRSRDVDIEQSLNHSIEDDEQSVVSSMKGKYYFIGI